MKKKNLIDFMVGIFLIILASIILVLPRFKVQDLKDVFIILWGFYALFKFIQFIFTFKEKDYESILFSLASLGALLAIYFIPFKIKNYILVLMIWMGLVSLIKLKKADFYHDRQNKMWLIRIFGLIVFIISGILTGINMQYSSSVQILMVGNFFFINGILDTIDPIINYILGGKDESSK